MSKKAKKKKLSKKGKIALIILIVLIVIVTAGIGAFCYIFGGLDTVDFTADKSELGISDKNVEGITNIALFGVDSRDKNSDQGLSDSIIILSVNENDNTIKMISVLRDTWLAVEGFGNQKINAAYYYGGPVLAVKTLNQYFNLDIKEYATVNFSQLADVIDAVGGVDLTITEVEAYRINLHKVGKVSSGDVTLTGSQAVAYSRIRVIDNDSTRASRQQNVLNAVFQKLKTMPKTEYPSVIREFLSLMETSLNYSDIIKLAPIAATDFKVESYRVPDAEYETDVWAGYVAPETWAYTYDLTKAGERINHIIYGTEYTPLPPRSGRDGEIDVTLTDGGDTVNALTGEPAQ